MDRRPTGSLVLLRRSSDVLLAAVPIALATFIAFLALAWASLGVDRTVLVDQVRAAYASRDLRPDAAALFGNVDIGEHQYNDCLILFQAIDDRASRVERTISPLRPVPTRQGICADLRQLVTAGPGQPRDFYHRYFHAHTTFARLLVPELGVAGLRDLYKFLICLVLCAGIGFAMMDIARRRRDMLGVVWLIIFLAFARFYGFEAFGQSLGHAPADLTILGFLLIISRVSVDRPISRRFALISAAAFGALTIETEFLTGGLPLGLAVLLGTVPFAVAADRDALRTTMEAAISFAVAIATCVIARMLLLLVMFGTAPLAGAGAQLLVRTGMAAPPDQETAKGAGSFLIRVLAGMDSLAAGMPWLVIGLLGLTLTSGIWGYRVLRSGADDAVRRRALALVASNVVLLLWIVVFWEHTTVHAWFMDRIFVWTLASGAILFALAVRSQDAAVAIMAQDPTS